MPSDDGTLDNRKRVRVAIDFSSHTVRQHKERVGVTEIHAGDDRDRESKFGTGPLQAPRCRTPCDQSLRVDPLQSRRPELPRPGRESPGPHRCVASARRLVRRAPLRGLNELGFELTFSRCVTIREGAAPPHERVTATTFSPARRRAGLIEECIPGVVPSTRAWMRRILARWAGMPPFREGRRDRCVDRVGNDQLRCVKEPPVLRRCNPGALLLTRRHKLPDDARDLHTCGPRCRCLRSVRRQGCRPLSWIHARAGWFAGASRRPAGSRLASTSACGPRQTDVVIDSRG